MLEACLAQVSPAVRELVSLTAKIGREFSFRLLAQASGNAEDSPVLKFGELSRLIVQMHGTQSHD